jgi:hypothetical protein
MPEKRYPSEPDSQAQPIPKAGEHYTRRFGDRQTVEVKGVSPDGFVKIRDGDGMHFVRVATFHDFFERAG